VAELASHRPEQLDASIALLELNLEFFPKSINTRTALGDRLIAKGDTAAAVKRWQEALELQPGNRFVQGKIDAARGARH
jgi:predicted negative regulator of RcsB-dependent stress response